MQQYRLASEVLADSPTEICGLHKDVFKSVILGWLKERSYQPFGEEAFEDLWLLLDTTNRKVNKRKRGRPKKVNNRVLSRKAIEEIRGIFEETESKDLPESGADRQLDKSTENSRVYVKLEIERLFKLSEKKCTKVFFAMVLESLKDKINVDISDEEFCLSFGLNRKTISKYKDSRSFPVDDNVKLKSLHDSITERLRTITIEFDSVSKD